MTIVEAILYGIVQGLTEWLPVSSTAHLRILPSLLGKPDPGAGFTAVIQLGTTLAVLIFFRKELSAAIGGWLKSFKKGSKSGVDAKVGWGVFWGTFPIIIIGFLAQDFIKSDAVRSLYVIAATLMLGGLLMLGAEQYAKGRKGRGEAKIEVKDGLVVGAFQALALIPGMSRSGSTISGALFSGLDRNTAARYSFLLSVPSVAAAGLYELYKGKAELLDAGITNVLVATAVSFVVGYASIALLLKFIQKQGIGVFVLYRFVVAGVLLLMLQRGLIQ